jgi:hypothetical protein
MASTDSRPVPRKNTAYRAYFPVLDNTGSPVSGAAALDSERSIDGAAFADCTNEATEIGTSGIYYLDLTSGEMNGDAVVVRVQTTTTDAKTTVLVFYPEEAGDYRSDVVQWLGTAVTAGTAGVPNVDITRIANAAVSTSTAQLGVNVVNAAGTAWGSGAITAGSIAADAITAAKVASDVSTEFATTYFGTAIPGAFGAGTAGSRLGKLPDVTAGASGGVFIAGTNAATTITTGLTTTFTGNLTGSVASVTGAVGSVTGAVGSVTGAVGSVSGNVTGSVGSVAAGGITNASFAADAISAAKINADVGAEYAAAILNTDMTGFQTQGTLGQAIGDPTTGASLIGRLPNATPGATGGVFIAGTNAATTITTGLTTTFTGNLTGSVASVTGAVGSVTGSVGSVTGSVGSVTGLTASNLDATVSSRLASASYTAPPSAVTNAAAVWDEDATAHQTAGTFGKAIGDPLTATNSLIQRTPDAVAGAANGLFIAGTNAATTITTGLTTTFTGNLTGSVGSVTGAVGSVTGLTASNLDATVSSRSSQASVDTIDDFLDTEISAIQTAVVTTIPGTITTLQADTDNIQTRLPAALVSGRMDASVGAVATDVIDATALATSAVNEIAAAVGALAGTDPAGVPATTATLAQKIDWLCALARNKRTTTATTETLRNDGDTTSVATAAVSDDGSQFVRGKWT